MKKTLLLTGVLLALTASIALAGGVNVAWGTACWTENPTALKTFACNVNTSTAAFQWPIQITFALDAEMTDMVAIEAKLEGQSALATFPDYWKVDATGCRPNMMTFNGDVSSIATDPLAGGCGDWTGGNQLFGLIGYTYDTNRSHIVAGGAISAAMPQDVMPNLEYYVGTLVFKNSKTVGTGACTGCASPFILGVYQVQASGLAGGVQTMMAPIGGEQIGNQCIRWNDPNSTLPCGPPIPAKSTTWGAVKSLYR